jgi:hypothetical protein
VVVHCKRRDTAVSLPDQILLAPISCLFIFIFLSFLFTKVVAHLAGWCGSLATKTTPKTLHTALVVFAQNYCGHYKSLVGLKKAR